MSEPSTRRLVRLLGATFVGGLTIGFLPGVAAATPPEPPAEQSTTAFCANVPATYEPFTDVTGNKANIECAAAAGLTQGTSTPTLYNPGGVVSRAQMASFIARLIDKANELDVPGSPDLASLPAYDGVNEFTDSPDPAHVANINRLADANIVLGGPGGRPATQYGGGLPVQRDQMASFINRAQDFLGDGVVDGDGYSSASDYFTDDNTSVHEDNIQAIASRGIAIGDGVDTYLPRSGVTRDQMASFLVRHLADNFEAGLITAAPAPTGGNNQTLTVTPTAPASLVFVAPNPDTDTSDDRQYTVSGLAAGTTYRITLVNGNNVTTSAGGEVTFVEEGTTGLASAGVVAADITVVNGTTNAVDTDPVAPGIQSQSVGGVVPVSGNITFTVDGEAAEAVVPVVYVDAGASTRLELNADNSGRPIEAFGIGGRINYVPTEAGGGAIAAGAVTAVDKVADSYATAAFTYFYDATDTFSIGATPVTLAAFEAALSSGDTVTGTYAPDPAAPSTFSLANNNPATPTGVVVTSTSTGASVAYVTGAGDFDSVNVYRALSANNTDCTTTLAASYAMVGSDTNGTPFVDTTVVRPEQYCYTVALVNDGDEGDRAVASGFVSLTAADAAAPTSADVRLTTSAGVAGQLDIGDSFKVAFSEVMASLADADAESLVVRDADGTFGTISVTNATLTLNAADETVGGVVYPADRVLTVTLTGVIAPTTAGSVPGMQIPTTISDQGGFADTSGNAWNIAGSADVIIDVEA